MAGRITLRMLARGKQDFALGECLCAAFMWVREWGAGVVRQSEWWVNGDSCVIGVMVDGNVWVQCMMGNVVHGWCAVWVSGNQIHNTRYNLFAHSPALHTLSHCTSYPLFYFLFVSYFILTIFVYIYILSRVLFHSFYCFYVIMFYFLFFALSIERTCPD